MADIKWIKITTDMFEDEKINFIDSLPEKDTILVLWVKLLTLAGKINAEGLIYLTPEIPYTEEMLAHKFNRPINTVKLAVDTFQRLNMIKTTDNGHLSIANWHKHQNVIGMQKTRELTKLRVQKHRENQRLIGHTGCNVTQRYSNATVTQQNKNKNKNKNKNIKHKYGEFKNVFLTDEELEKLKTLLNGQTQNWIEKLSEGIELKGYKYKSHYLAIRKWHQKNNQGLATPPDDNPVLDPATGVPAKVLPIKKGGLSARDIVLRDFA